MEIVLLIIFLAIILLDCFCVYQINFLNKVKRNPDEFCIVNKRSGFRVSVGGNGGSLSPIRRIEKKASQKNVISSNPNEIKKMVAFSIAVCIWTVISSLVAFIFILTY